MISVIGENVVDLFSEVQGHFIAKLGGSPFNFAMAAAKQGCKVQYLSPISTDAFGDEFAVLLQQHQILYSEQNRSQRPSSLAFVRVDEQGQPHYSLYRQGIADRDYQSEQLIQQLHSNTQILHTGSLALEPQDADKIIAILQAAKAKNILLSVDINVRRQFVSDFIAYRQHIEHVVALCDFIKASDEDLMALYPEMPTGLALQKFLALSPNALVAFTRGELGSQLWQQGQYIEQAIIPPRQFVDTVGAGDTFYSNLLCGILALAEKPNAARPIKIATLTSVLLRATLAASINVSRQGCQPPSQIELDVAFADYINHDGNA